MSSNESIARELINTWIDELLAKQYKGTAQEHWKSIINLAEMYGVRREFEEIHNNEFPDL